MGRAYEVRKASIQKTGAARGKIYTTFAKEIYLAAKKGIPDPDSNIVLKRIIEKAKKNEVPSDIINRAIDKAKGMGQDEYEVVTYEGFGPGASTLIIKCLTDNVNRSVSAVRAVVNKCHIKMGAIGSVMYMYENLSIIGFKGLDEEQVMDAFIENDVDVKDIEENNGMIMAYADPQELFAMKEAIHKVDPKIEFEVDEITWLPKEKVTLTGEDKETFERAIHLLDECEDVNHIYHNVAQ